MNKFHHLMMLANVFLFALPAMGAEPLILEFAYQGVRQQLQVQEDADFLVIVDVERGTARAAGHIGRVEGESVQVAADISMNLRDGGGSGNVFNRPFQLGHITSGTGTMPPVAPLNLVWLRRGVDPVPTLVATLDRGNVRSIFAARRLGLLGDAAREAVPNLVAVLKSEDEGDGQLDDGQRIRLREAVAGALGEIGEAASNVVEPLAVSMEDTSAKVRVAAAAALWKISRHPLTLPTLIAVLNDDERIVRIKALDALAEMGVAAAAAESNVAGLLRDEDNEVRAKAAYVLWSSMRDPRAINALDEMLRADNSGYERAAQSLDRIGYPDAHRAAKSLAARVFSGRAPSPYVTSALRTIDPAAIGTLPVLLDTVRKDNTPKSREAAGVALAAFGSPIVPQLHRLLDGEHEADWQVAMYALGNMEDAAAIQMLAAALRHANPQVRKLAAGWLHGIEGPIALAIPDLVHALNDEVEAVRVEASSALTFVGRPALPTLKSLLNSGSARVRESVAELIEYIELEHEMDAAVDGLTRE